MDLAYITPAAKNRILHELVGKTLDTHILSDMFVFHNFPMAVEGFAAKNSAL